MSHYLSDLISNHFPSGFFHTHTSLMFLEHTRAQSCSEPLHLLIRSLCLKRTSPSPSGLCPNITLSVRAPLTILFKTQPLPQHVLSLFSTLFSSTALYLVCVCVCVCIKITNLLSFSSFRM